MHTYKFTYTLNFIGIVFAKNMDYNCFRYIQASNTSAHKSREKSEISQAKLF